MIVAVLVLEQGAWRVGGLVVIAPWRDRIGRKRINTAPHSFDETILGHAREEQVYLVSRAWAGFIHDDFDFQAVSARRAKRFDHHALIL